MVPSWNCTWRIYIVVILSFLVVLKFAKPNERADFNLSDLPVYKMPKRSSDEIVQNEKTFPKKVGDGIKLQ